MAERAHRPARSGAVRTTVVWNVLRDALDERAKASGRSVLDVVDAGGGTGGFAVPLAGLGHRVTVVDSSPDALAGLERRAAEAGVSVRAVQGDADRLHDLDIADGADLVLCHSVLEYVDDPATAMRSISSVVRPGGAVSVLAAGRLAAVLHRAVAGCFDEARRALADTDTDTGSAPRRFIRDELSDLIDAAGLTVAMVHGVRIFADLVPGGTMDGAAEALIALELAAADHPVLRDLATQLHVLARR